MNGGMIKEVYDDDTNVVQHTQKGRKGIECTKISFVNWGNHFSRISCQGDR